MGPVDCPSRVEHREDSARDGVGGLVLPRADDMPAGGAESAVDAPITRGVAFELRAPIADVATGCIAVLRAAVPEAAINEDGDPPAREDDVRPNRDIRRADGVVHSKA